MDIEIDVTELQKRKIAILTPMYGGMCHGHYTKSMIDLANLTAKYGIDCTSMFIFNESLVQRARNYLADEFLRSHYTHAMFIDSDIGFDAQDVLALSALATPGSEYDIVCGPYPKKVISWPKVKRAVDKGLADKDANALEKFVGDYVFNPADGTSSIAVDRPAEIMEGGTGFMMIQRSALERFAEAYPGQAYLPDHVGTNSFDGSREIHAFFDCVIDPVSKRYLSEDYYFCQQARKAGLKVWLAPWMKMNHTGSYTFTGSLSDIATLGMSATFEPSVARN